jgi:hypothetical protein
MDYEPGEPPAPPPAKPSKTPSWIMLGFVLGVVFMLALPRKADKPVEPPALRPVPGPATAQRPTVDRAVYFEAVFAEWGQRAVWENELTEVAFWNAEQKAFSDRYEVLRMGDRFFFRSILHFTRPRLTHGVPDDSPLEFTEPQARRDEWLRENSAENLRAFLEAPRAAPETAPKQP